MDTEMREDTKRISHRDTETQRKILLCVSVSPWLISLCVLSSLCVGFPRR